jgi:GTPase SAR1 family protein
LQATLFPQDFVLHALIRDFPVIFNPLGVASPIASHVSSAVRMPLRAAVVVCGPRSSGKTCLIRRLAEGTFNVTPPTVCVDFGVLSSSSLRLDVFDLSGAESFAEARVDFYRDAAVLVLVFDVRASGGVAALEAWLAEAKTNGLPVSARRIVVGTHIDFGGQRSEPLEKARSWAAAHGAGYIEVGARSGVGSTEAISALAENAQAALTLKEAGRRKNEPSDTTPK